MSKRGRLIVIDGTDGSGKHTQAGMLVRALRKKGKKVRALAFPQYNSFFGKLIADYLNGKYGRINDIPAELPSLFYALDRFVARKKINNWLKNGQDVILDRYVQSNLAYQCAKIKNKKEKKKLEKWLLHIEHNILKNPRPDLTIFLYVPQRISERLVKKRPKKGYLKGKIMDIHEKNKGYILAVTKEYLRLSKELNWKRIDCVRKGKIMSREEIHKKILAAGGFQR